MVVKYFENNFPKIPFSQNPIFPISRKTHKTDYFYEILLYIIYIIYKFSSHPIFGKMGNREIGKSGKKVLLFIPGGGLVSFMFAKLRKSCKTLFFSTLQIIVEKEKDAVSVLMWWE